AASEQARRDAPSSFQQAMSSAQTAPAATQQAETAKPSAALSDIGAVSGPASAPVQQASLAVAQAATAAPSDKLSPPVGSPAWDQAVGQKVVWMAVGGEQSATLTLNPPDLGPLQVVVNVSNDQATASFSSAQPEVRDALEQAMPKLREMMSEAGIELSSSTVGTSLPQQHNAPNEQRQASSQNGQSGRAGGSDNAGLADATARPAAAKAASALGLVDTFA
ncbi:MAG TPA: flagellar hook-length control protein FliK, partial [Burkholderiaceae bacterium]